MYNILVHFIMGSHDVAACAPSHNAQTRLKKPCFGFLRWDCKKVVHLPTV